MSNATPQRGAVEHRSVPGPRGTTATWPMIYSGTEWLRLHSDEGEALFAVVEAEKRAMHEAEIETAVAEVTAMQIGTLDTTSG